MGRRGRDPGAERPAPGLNAPFAGLGKRLQAQVRSAPPPPKKPPARPPDEPEPDPFAQAMAGVVPLARDVDRRIDLPPPAGAGRRPVSEEAEALAVLSDLVEGGTRFDITDTREYVEGAIVGLDVR